MRTPGPPRRGAARKKHRTTATSLSLTWSPSRPRRSGSRNCARRCRNCPPPGGPGCRGGGGWRPPKRPGRHTGGGWVWGAETVPGGAPPAEARKWWLGELSRRANESGTELAALPVTPAQVARVTELVASGALNDKLARQVLDGILAGEGGSDEIVAARGLTVVS